MRMLSKEQAYRKLQAAIEEAGTLTAFCDAHGLNKGNISLMANGKIPIPDSVARVLGLRKTVRYLEVA